MTQRKKAGDNGAGLLTWVQGLAPACAKSRASSPVRNIVTL